MLNRCETPLASCNLKFNEVGGLDSVSNGLFEGYAATFGNIDAFGDTVMKGAFTETITDRKFPVLMLAGHSSRAAVGKWLEMAEDDTGLYVYGEFTPGNSVASDTYASMRHGAITGLSIGFRIPAGGAEEIEGGGRRISKVQLEEISVVGFPADAEARVSVVKSEIESIESIRDCEMFLRDVGLSQPMAKAFISQCRPLYQREVDAENERKEAHQADLNWLRGLTNTR